MRLVEVHVFVVKRALPVFVQLVKPLVFLFGFFFVGARFLQLVEVPVKVDFL
jgi:hypothetical protein